MDDDVMREVQAPPGLPTSARDRAELTAELTTQGFVLSGEHHFGSVCAYCKNASGWVAPMDQAHEWMTPHTYLSFDRREGDRVHFAWYGSCGLCSSPFDYEADDSGFTTTAGS